MKLFSIIVATYNSEDIVQNCLQSIVNQSFTDYEIIIIDGKSKDGTLRAMEKFASNITHLVSEADKGVYDAWNKGLKLASGKWVMFVGTDDELLTDSLQSYADFIKKNSFDEMDFISSKNILINKKGETLRIFGEAWNWKVFKKYMNVAHVGALHSNAYFQSYGLFNAEFKIAGDYELLLRAKSKLKSAFLDKINAKMGYGGISTANTRVFKEAFNAKHNSGGVSYLNCLTDDCIARIKYVYRKIVHRYE